jgi:Fic family protein
MEPLLPRHEAATLRGLAVDVIRESAALGGALHPITRAAVVGLLRRMQSYYSNLIEGHDTHPVDIDRALRHDYARQPAKRALQIEAAAHVEVQEQMEARLEAEPGLPICSAEFLCGIHQGFYRRLPEELHWVERPDGAKRKVVPGQLRDEEVRVGRHIAPRGRSLRSFLERFEEAYRPERFDDLDRVVAAVASHHRLLWIHPFLDGNGRVARLFTHAYLQRARIDGHGLWTLTRGFARRRDAYLAALEEADEPRRGDLDGRGNLSEQGLSAFCRFALETALDQIRFMQERLELPALQDHVLAFAKLASTRGELHAEAGAVLREVLLRGEMPRGEASRVTGLSARSAQSILGDLLKQGLLVSESPKGPIRLGLPAHAVGYYFPRLYPESVEVSPKGSGRKKR